MKEVVLWSPEEVASWLMDNAMPEYCEPLKSFTGRDLINLTEEDFKKSPLSRVSSDSGQRLLNMIEGLKMAHHMEAHKNGHANGHIRAGNPARQNGFGAALNLKSRNPCCFLRTCNCSQMLTLLGYHCAAPTISSSKNSSVSSPSTPKSSNPEHFH